MLSVKKAHNKTAIPLPLFENKKLYKLNNK